MIVSQLPHQRIQTLPMHQLNLNLNLADPSFDEPGPVDMLIEADLYYSIITGLHHKLDCGPYAIEKIFGWVISGSIDIPASTHIHTYLVRKDLSTVVRKFWELEEVDYKPIVSDDNQLAEQLFETQHYRNEQGRYITPLLFKLYPPNLGKSYHSALSCYRYLRNRKNQHLLEDYQKFMQDYLHSNHMSRLNQPPHNQDYFIPHHCILRPESTTTKLRVVFNGSEIITNGKSLNSEILSGPALQVGLPKVIMNQRRHPIILTADIRQKYRQVLVLPEHQNYQLILWSFDLKPYPDVYQLHTVTYGTSCAPFIAQRTLHQLVHDEGNQFPAASKAITEETFVDDIVTGSETLAKALELKSELTALLAKGGMELRKWLSNRPEVLHDIPEDHKQLTELHSLDPLLPNQLVLIKNDNLPPLQWKMGRVVDVSPGRDKITRVVKLKTANGTLTRPVVKLAPLSINPISHG